MGLFDHGLISRLNILHINTTHSVWIFQELSLRRGKQERLVEKVFNHLVLLDFLFWNWLIKLHSVDLIDFLYFWIRWRWIKGRRWFRLVIRWKRVKSQWNTNPWLNTSNVSSIRSFNIITSHVFLFWLNANAICNMYSCHSYSGPGIPSASNVSIFNEVRLFKFSNYLSLVFNFHFISLLKLN